MYLNLYAALGIESKKNTNSSEACAVMSVCILVLVLTKLLNLSSLDARRTGLLYCAAIYILSFEFIQLVFFVQPDEH